MTSYRMRAVSLFVRLAYKPRMATVERARERIAAAKGSSDPPAALGKRHDVRSREVAGFRCAAGGSELPLAAAIRARARSTVAIRGL